MAARAVEGEGRARGARRVEPLASLTIYLSPLERRLAVRALRRIERDRAGALLRVLGLERVRSSETARCGR